MDLREQALSAKEASYQLALAGISQKNADSSQGTMNAAKGVGSTMQNLEQASENLLRLSDVLKDCLVVFKM